MATAVEDHTVLKGYCDTAIELAKRSGQIARDALRNNIAMTTKASTADIVTEVDKKVEDFIISTLKEKYITHKFIGEESVVAHEAYSDTPTWIIDPIDGTANYIHGFPFSAISIGLSVNKQNVVGVAYNFVLDQLYTAIKGSGAYLNGAPIRVSSCRELRRATVITDIGYTRNDWELNPKMDTFKSLAAEPSHVHGMRTLGSAVCSMCLVAQGCADAYTEYGVHCWDMAAAELIVREAGGVALSPTGAPLDIMDRGILVASSMELAQAMLPHISHITKYERD